LVLTLHFLEGNDSSSLLVHNGTEASFALDDDVGDAHLTAQSRQENDQLDGVYVVSDDDEGSLLGFDEGDDMVQAIFDEQRLLRLLKGHAIKSYPLTRQECYLRFVTSGNSLGSGLETLLLLLLSLRAVLVQELEQLGSRVFVESVRELGDGGWNLEALVEDDLLALETDVLGPFHETCQVRARTDVLAYKDKISAEYLVESKLMLTDTKVLWGRLEKRVFLLLFGLACTEWCSGRFLTGSGFGLGRLVIETRR